MGKGAQNIRLDDNLSKLLKAATFVINRVKFEPGNDNNFKSVVHYPSDLSCIPSIQNLESVVDLLNLSGQVQFKLQDKDKIVATLQRNEASMESLFSKADIIQKISKLCYKFNAESAIGMSYNIQGIAAVTNALKCNLLSNKDEEL